MVFNILVNNNDDHLRNHGFVYDSSAQGWRLSPLYDVVPGRFATERYLHLAIGHQGREASLSNAMSQYGVFGLTRASALSIIERVGLVVREWRVYFEQAGLPATDIERVASAFRPPRDIGMNHALN